MLVLLCHICIFHPHINVFLSTIDSISEPSNFLEASKHKNWVEAKKNEIEALERNHTWSIVYLPQRKIPTGCKWIYELKYKVDGSIKKYKAHLVAKGYSQKEGIDCHETFPPVVRMVIVRIVTALASINEYSLFLMDVHNDFLQEDLNEKVYM